MSRIQALLPGAVSINNSAAGIIRHIAFHGEDCLVVLARSAPGAVSGWRYADYDVYRYVAAGSACFEGNSQEDAISLEQGAFFHVPPHTLHREVNPSAREENEVILFLLGQGALAADL